MKKRWYIAIIGDIRDSRLLNNRNDVQKYLIESLNQINEKYQEHIASDFSISMGDSIQGLLNATAPFTEIILAIELLMHSVDFRFGIGVGEIATEIDPENSQLNDGPAYHRARQVLEWIEEKEQKYSTRKTNIMILSQDEETPSDRLINAIFALNTVIRKSWTERQKEVIKAFLENNENQYQTAEVLNVGQSTISKALKSADFYAYQSALADIEDFMMTKLKERDNV